jgi:hypothetical protein
MKITTKSFQAYSVKFSTEANNQYIYVIINLTNDTLKKNHKPVNQP